MNQENITNNLTVVEGMTSLSALINAIESGVNNRKIVRVIITAEAAADKIREVSFLRRKSGALGYEIKVVSREELDSIASGNTHGGIAALCTERMFSEISAEKIPQKGFFALLEGIEDPYNFGYTVRSLYAAGADGIILGERNWMSAASTVIKASAGTTELIDIYTGDTAESVRKFKEAGYRVVCAGIRDSVSLYEADLKKPLLLIIGGVKRGISRTLIDLSNEIVRIDYGRKFMGSLTTASSAAVIAFEIMRRNT
jgi:23S rRNA (guanosine2251-2'-O)-methyltransferase